VLGLAAAFLAQGARQLVASVMPIPDLQTASLMSALHRELAAGRPVAEALATAQEQTARLGTVELAVAAGFACIGAGLSPA
jgi:CHAT domain-containing protein